MTQLAIKVRGEVLSSNFDEWKLDLIAKIKAVNTELSTDTQFAQAQSDVKSFKAAEQALTKAKEAAINQASDIQRLFLRIPRDSCHRFQTKPATHSRGKLPLIPDEACHRFHGKAAT